MRILALSDPHMDFRRGSIRRFLETPVECDAIVVAGDTSNDEHGCRSLFRRLRSWHTGPIYAVPGNHDHWWGNNG